MMYMIKKIYSLLLDSIVYLWGVDSAKKFDAYFRYRRKLDLKEPKTLADKVCYIELHKQSSLASICTDKYAVRDYIKKKGFEDILIPLVGGPWSKVEEIDFEKIDFPCVLKATHGCKMNYFITDRNSFDIKTCKKEMYRWMNTTYGTYSVEPHYRDIPHRIYAEKYLGDQKLLIDYKFHCMNGVPQYILAVRDRISDGDKKMKEIRELYDLKWNPIDGVKENGSYNTIGKPKNLNRMIRIAKCLSSEFVFVRVDLYEINGNIYFGELTFSPTGGVFSSYTDDFLLDMGNKLIL